MVWGVSEGETDYRLCTSVGDIVAHCNEMAVALYAHGVVVVANSVRDSRVAHGIIQELLHRRAVLYGRLLFLFAGAVVIINRLDVLVMEVFEES